MSQNDLVIANQSFPSFRTDLNSALQAINTSQSGTSRPSGAVAGTIWLDTTSATSPTLKYYDGADDISLATIDHVGNTVNWLDSTVSITGLSTTATATVLTLTDSAHTTTVNMVLGNNTALRFNELTANGSNYIGLKAPASLSADLTFTLPSLDGTSGQFLKTDGAGNLSFATAGLTGATSTATGTVFTLSDTANVTTQNLIIDNQKEVRFRETTANGTNYVGMKAPASLTADLTYTLPSADGTSGQVLQTNGSGVLSFSSPSSDYVLLATTDASASASVSFDGYFSATYKNYKILCSNLTTSSNYLALRVRFRRSNADVTASNYYHVVVRLYIVDAALGAIGDTGNSFALLINENTASTSGYNSSFSLDLYDALGTNNYKNATFQTIGFDTGVDNRHHFENGALGLTGSTLPLSGITFLPSSGTITRGNFKLYGIK